MAMQKISSIVDNHHKTMKKGEPQLNYCDRAVMVGLRYYVMGMNACMHADSETTPLNLDLP